LLPETTLEARKSQLYSLKNYKGVSNDSISFDRNGDLVSANFEVVVIRNGKAVSLSLP